MFRLPQDLFPWIQNLTTKEDQVKSKLFQLTFIYLWAKSADDKFIIVFIFFSQKIGFDSACNLSPVENRF